MPRIYNHPHIQRALKSSSSILCGWAEIATYTGGVSVRTANNWIKHPAFPVWSRSRNQVYSTKQSINAFIVTHLYRRAARLRAKLATYPAILPYHTKEITRLETMALLTAQNIDHPILPEARRLAFNEYFRPKHAASIRYLFRGQQVGQSL